MDIQCHFIGVFAFWMYRPSEECVCLQFSNSVVLDSFVSFVILREYPGNDKACTIKVLHTQLVIVRLCTMLSTCGCLTTS